MHNHQSDLNSILEHADTMAVIKNQQISKPVYIIDIILNDDNSIAYVEAVANRKELNSHRFFTWIGFNVGVDLNKFIRDIISRINNEHNYNVEFNYSDNIIKHYGEIIPPLPYINDFIKASEKVMNTFVNVIPELTLTIPRSELTKNGWGMGTHSFNIDVLDPKQYSFIPRKWINDKTNDDAQEVGFRMPQIIPYTIVKDKDGKILTYRRKSKDPNLLGRYSIGVGGHVELCDMILTGVNINELDDIVINGQCRELVEEIQLSLHDANFSKYHTIIALDNDKTNRIHVAFVSDVVVEDVSKLVFDPNEFFDVEWLTSDELIARLNTTNFEPWTVELINHFK